MDAKRLPLSRAWTLIFIWTLMVSGSVTLTWLYYLQWKQNRGMDPHYTLRYLKQSGPGAGLLPSEYLAELCALSQDEPSNYYLHNLKAAEKRLQDSPLIVRATLKRIYPDTLEVWLELPRPVAILANWSGVLVTREGTFFPAIEGWDWKDLPLVRLSGEDRPEWKMKTDDPTWDVARLLMDLLDDPRFPLRPKVIDVSQVFAESCGREELVLEVEDEGYRRCLRLDPKNLGQNLGDYLVLREHFQGKKYRTVDLRLAGQALIDLEEEVP